MVKTKEELEKEENELKEQEIAERRKRLEREKRDVPLRAAPEDSGGGGRGGGFNLWAVILPAALAVICCLGLSQLGYLGGVKPETYNAFVQAVQDNYAMKSEIPEIPDLTQYAKQTDLEGYATLDDLSDAAPDLSGYFESDDFGAAMNDWWNSNAGSKLNEWWASHGGSSDSGDGDGTLTDCPVTCELEPASALDSGYYPSPDDYTEVQVSILANVTNISSYDLEKLKFEVLFNFNRTFGTLTLVDNPVLVSGGEISGWQLSPYGGVSPYHPFFTSVSSYGWGTGFTLGAGESRDMYLTLTIKYEGDVPVSGDGALIMGEPEMECVGCEIAD